MQLRHHYRSAALGGSMILAATGIVPAIAGAAEIISLRSGFDESGGVPLVYQTPTAPLPAVQDVNIFQIHATASNIPLSPTAFTASTFAAARAGPAAFAIEPESAWRGGTSPFKPFANLSSPLVTDNDARWINYNPTRYLHDARSAMYAVPFTIQTQNIASATVDFQWLADDTLGDWIDPVTNTVSHTPDANHPNIAGVYFGAGSGTGVQTSPMIYGGSYNPPSIETRSITSLVQPGQNWLYIYQRDLGAGAAGLAFTMRMTVDAVPEPTSGVVTSAGLGAALLRRRRRGMHHATVLVQRLSCPLK